MWNFCFSHRQGLFWNGGFSQSEAGAVEVVWKLALPFENKKKRLIMLLVWAQRLWELFMKTLHVTGKTCLFSLWYLGEHICNINKINSHCSKMPSSGSLCLGGTVPRAKTGPSAHVAIFSSKHTWRACLVLHCTLPYGRWAQSCTKLYLRGWMRATRMCISILPVLATDVAILRHFWARWHSEHCVC